MSAIEAVVSCAIEYNKHYNKVNVLFYFIATFILFGFILLRTSTHFAINAAVYLILAFVLYFAHETTA